MVLLDAQKAFLQGEQDASERSGPIYMESPRDAILTAANAYPSPLYQITGNCYGLSNAPRTWYKKVDKDLLNYRFKRHSLDRCCYYFVNDDGMLTCVLIVHVDDFMLVYNTEKFNIDDEKVGFRWGSIVYVFSWNSLENIVAKKSPCRKTPMARSPTRSASRSSSKLWTVDKFSKTA